MATNSTWTSELADVLEGCLRSSNPLDAFNETVLGRVNHDPRYRLHDGSKPGSYWRMQRRIASALWEPDVTNVVVPAGHSVGKSFFAAGAVHGWLGLHPDSLVVTTSPSNTQLTGVLWKEIRRARSCSPILSRIGRMTRLPNQYDLGDGWQAVGYATNKAERLQGWHSKGPLLVIVDEASGIEDEDIWATLRSLKPRKMLLLGNTLRARGHFYSMCQRAKDDPTVRRIKIPSTLSPDINQQFSARGLADRHFLEEMAADYGIGSQMWKVRVEAEFPEASDDRLVPLAWLDACARADHQAGGTRRISVDLAKGNGGDDAVIVVRDDNGILAWEISNLLNLESTASKVALLAQRFRVKPEHVSFDVEGIGTDFANRLHQVNLKGCVPYRGGKKGKNPKYGNLRTAAHFALRRRLNPEHRDADNRRLPTFAIPPELAARLRKELAECYILEPGTRGENRITSGEELRAALKRSPDLLDALTQSFAFLN